MKLQELSAEFISQLKQQILVDKMCNTGCQPSWFELSQTDSEVSDEELYEAYSDTEFVPEDFMFFPA